MFDRNDFEDTDEDELNNLEELKVGTDCIKPDTDNDGILDGDEVKIYKTSPILEDTDGDTISDGDEIRLGLNPLKAYSDDITHDSKRKFQQSLSEENIEPYLMDSENLLVPYINGLVSDVIDKNIYVGHYNNDAIQDNRAIIGEPVRIHSSYTEEDELTLGFNYSGFLSYYAEDDLNTLVICRYIEDDFLPLETELDKLNRTLNANITGGGIYFVLDLEEFLSGFGIYTQKSLINNDVDIRSFDEEFVILSVDDESVANDVPEEWLEEYDSNRTKNNLFDSQVAVSNHDLTYSVLNKSLRNSVKGQADITFVIDTTGSMYSAIYNVQNNISKFVDRLTSEYNVQVNFALVDYKDITDDGLDSTRVIKNGTSNWFSNVEMYKNKISNLYINGGGDTPETAIDGLAMAYNLDYRSNANKFVVLVTDADYKVNNQYGIKSMNEISDMLKSKNIITSVIAPTYYRSYYTTLYQNTDGIFADIYGDFSSELLKLADRIGEAVNDGTWVLLSDYQYVKLDAEVSPTNGVDTDEDGISDYRELGVKEERDLSQLVKLLLKIKGIPEELYEGKTSVTVYRYITNPVLVDTDFDGLNDNDSRDLVKRDNGLLDANAFSGDIIGYFKVPIKIDFTVDYSQFFIKSNTSYHRDLSVLGSIYATAAYHGDVNVTSGARQSGKLIDIYRLFGLQDVKNYKLAAEFSDDDISEVFIGHRLVEYKGEKKDIIFVSVRGTNGTIQEWSSNFDVGANTDDYWDRNNIYWRNKSNHKGFDATANRVYDYIIEYVENNVSKDAKKVIYITGHSRGAGISNILGSQFEKKSDYETYIYTFACPNTTTDVNASTYKTIFNIVNSDDIITYLPLEEWNFGKYGQTEPYTISVKQYYEDSSPFKNKVGTYEWLVGKDYNNDGGTKRTLKAFVKVAKDREELYKYDMTKDGVVNPHNKYHTTIKGAQEQLEKVKQELIDQRLDQLSYAYIDDGILKNVLVRYKPAFLMQVLANMTCGVGPTLGFDVNGKYASAKTSFVATSGKIGYESFAFGGMASPHAQESYILIVRNNFKPLP
ncbi:MAG: VWA domain-containing protein [Clostridiales bacterium]|nr:VWA domain-containing protein [Clostridiales bacterium]